MAARVLRAVGAVVAGAFLGAGLPVLVYGSGPMTDGQLELAAMDGAAVGAALLVAAATRGRRRLPVAVVAFLLACLAVQWREFGLTDELAVDLPGTVDRAKEALLPMVWASWLLWGRSWQPQPAAAVAVEPVERPEERVSAAIELDPVRLSARGRC